MESVGSIVMRMAEKRGWNIIQNRTNPGTQFGMATVTYIPPKKTDTIPKTAPARKGFTLPLLVGQ